MKLWSAADLQHERVLYNGTSWISDACFMKGASRIILCSTDRKLCVLDSTSGEILRAFVGRAHAKQDVRESMHLRNLQDRRKYGVALDMEKAWGDGAPAAKQCKTDRTTSFADFKQQMEQSHKDRTKKRKIEVTALKDLTEPPTALDCFVSEAGQESVLLGLRNGRMQLYNLSSALSGTRTVLHLTYDYQAHGSKAAPSSAAAITKIRLSKYLQSAITGSWDGTVRVTNLDTGSAVRELCGHAKSVFSLDWSETLKVIATCGTERHVLIWNPFIKKPVFSLQGHTASLLHVQFHDQDNQIVTAGYDRCVKVWDVRTFRCMQTLWDTGQGTQGEHRHLALSYDAGRHTIVTGTTYPSAFPMRSTSALRPTTTFEGHSAQCLGLFAAGSHESKPLLVSVDAEMVVVWEAWTGVRLFGFNAVRMMPDTSTRITAVAVDEPKRRLFTGAHDGTLMQWNYINGQPLGDFEKTSSEQVKCLCQCSDRGTLATAFVLSAVGDKLNGFADEPKPTVKQQSTFTTDKQPHSPQNTEAGEPSPLAIQCVGRLDRRVALGLNNGAIVVYNVQTQNQEGSVLHFSRVLQHPQLRRRAELERLRRKPYRVDAIVSLSSLIPDVIAVSTSDGFLEFWNVLTKRLVHLCQVRCAPAGSVQAPPSPSPSPRPHTPVPTSPRRSPRAGPVRKKSTVSILLKDHAAVTHLATNTTHSTLIAGTEHGAIAVLNLTPLSTGNPIRDGTGFQAHTHSITSLAWLSAGGGLIASSSADCSVKLHHESGLLVGLFGVHKWKIKDMDTWQTKVPAAPCSVDVLPVDVEESPIEVPDVHHSESGTEVGEDDASSSHTGRSQQSEGFLPFPLKYPTAACYQKTTTFAHAASSSGKVGTLAGTTQVPVIPSLGALPENVISPPETPRRAQTQGSLSARMVQEARRAGPQPPQTARKNGMQSMRFFKVL